MSQTGPEAANVHGGPPAIRALGDAWAGLVTTIEAHPTPVVVLAPDLERVQGHNRALCELLALDEEAVETSHPSIWLPEVERDTLANLARRSRQNASAVTGSLALRHGDGVRLDALAVVSAVDHADGSGSVVVGLLGLNAVMDLLDEIDRTRGRLRLVEERERIARNLHDNVIQRLLVVGLELGVALERLDVDIDTARATLERSVADIDASVTALRSAVFTMRTSLGGQTFAQEVHEALDESAEVLGAVPRLRVRGRLSAISDRIAGEAIAVIRELLSNVITHSQSDSHAVTLTIDEGWLSVTVEDDGVGVPADGTHEHLRGQGLVGIAERAERLGGHTRIEQRSPSGTIVTWSVPLSTSS